MTNPEVSVVMPCLNEAATIASCIHKAQRAMSDLRMRGEIVVADNGSTDGSAHIAVSLGATVLPVAEKGYGNALRAGIASARGTYIIFGDADDSYDFGELGRFVAELKNGCDLVTGTRLKGAILPGAMPTLHRYFGVPVLTALVNILFGTRVSDGHCGMRAFTNAAYRAMRIRSTGMEFASELLIEAKLRNLRIKEIPITYYPAGRRGHPHIRTFRDGVRHVYLMFKLFFERFG